MVFSYLLEISIAIMRQPNKIKWNHFIQIFCKRLILIWTDSVGISLWLILAFNRHINLLEKMEFQSRIPLPGLGPSGIHLERSWRYYGSQWVKDSSEIIGGIRGHSKQFQEGGFHSHSLLRYDTASASVVPKRLLSCLCTIVSWGTPLSTPGLLPCRRNRHSRQRASCRRIKIETTLMQDK